MSIRVIQGDITKIDADAIVNAANTTLLGGGGVDGAIHRAAGPALLVECRTLHGCATGEAKLTSGYNLPARFVIHTPGPIWHNGNHGEDGLLASCYRNSLLLADSRGCVSVAFPSISTGVYHFPIERAAGIALTTLTETLAGCAHVRQVTMVCFSESDRAVYQAALDRLNGGAAQ